MIFREYLLKLEESNRNEGKFFVLGNSSADYDSIFGSLVLAFLLSVTTGDLHIPIVDCRPEELSLRFEVMAVLKKYGIKGESVFFFQ